MDGIDGIERDRPKWGTAALLGCFSAAALTMIVLIALSFLAPRVADGLIETYTDPEPEHVAAVVLSEAEEEELRDRVDIFGEALDEGAEAEPLVLSEDELNALLQDAAEDSEREVSISVELLDGRIRAHISVPLNQRVSLGPWSRKLTGRYINGVATFDVGLADGELSLDLTSFEVKGERVPGWLLNRIRRALDESGLLEQEDVREIAGKLRYLEVSDGRIIATAEAPPGR